ncbi:MAG: hypothetical protein JWM82_2187 [Myxococcales bacterium]|nr:hypothetical protein [Myxococcales bacterium]
MVSARVQGIDVGAIERAVREAERSTSAEIRVAIPRFFWWGDVRRAAEEAFAALGMERTRERNGVLLYISPRRRRFAIVGDVGVHARVTGAFWDELAARVAEALRAGLLTTAVESAVAEIGGRLATLFPAPAGENVNELPDTLTR